MSDNGNSGSSGEPGGTAHARPTPVRRIVTGINSEGRSYFVQDGETPCHLDFGLMATSEIWADDPAQPDPDCKDDPVARKVAHLVPPQGGSRCRIFTFMPEMPSAEEMSELIAKASTSFELGDVSDPEDPAMHTTPTLDYAIILDGEIDLELDEGTLRMRRGDVAVQRATRHAWRNNSGRPCTVAFILVSSPNYR